MLRPYLPAIVIVLGFAAVGAALSVLFLPFVDRGDARTLPLTAGTPTTLPLVMAEPSFLTPRIDDAPPGLADAIERGARLVGGGGPIGSHREAGPLECSNCHFDGGRTPGGRNGGVSLVGVAACYPALDTTTSKALSLAERVSACAQSNGARALNDAELADVLIYLQWISRGIPVYANIPWLGLKPFSPLQPPDAQQGRFTFESICAQCHGPAGQGTPIAPALWGDQSFTDASQFTNPRTLAHFIRDNMPRQNPSIDAQQAADVAAFVLAQPRPAPAPATN